MTAKIVLTPSTGAGSTVVSIAATGFTTGSHNMSTITLNGLSMATTCTPSLPAAMTSGAVTITFIIPMATFGYGTFTVVATDDNSATASASFTITPVATIEKLAGGGMSQLGPGGSGYYASANTPTLTDQTAGIEEIVDNWIGNMTGISSAATNSSNATVTVYGQTMPVNYLVNAYIQFTSGPAIGLQLIIASNTASVITCTGVFGVAPTAAGGDSFIIVGNNSTVYTNIPPFAVGEMRTGTIVYSSDNQPLWVIWS
jgi:hypothetical protein